jgi:hypothetical protein
VSWEQGVALPQWLARVQLVLRSAVAVDLALAARSGANCRQNMLKRCRVKVCSSGSGSIAGHVV